MSEELSPDPAVLLALAQARMPFGKYRGRRLIDLPDAYLVWFARQGFPRGQLGQELRMVQELKSNGLDGLVRRLSLPR